MTPSDISFCRRQNAFVPACLAFVAFTASAFLIIGRLQMAHASTPASAAMWIVLAITIAFVAFLASVRFALAELQDLRARAEESDRHQARFLALAAGSVDAVFVLQAVRDEQEQVEDFAFSFLNSKAYDLLALPAGNIQGARAGSLLPFLQTEGLLTQYKNLLQTGGTSVDEFAVDQAEVHATWLRVSAMKFEDGVLLTATDLSEQKEFERQLCQMAHHDQLTKLPNRALLDDRIQQSIERARRNHHSAAVLILDIDNFKVINDTFGHAAGDHVLKTVANRLRDSIRASDSVFRLSGDEFVIVFSDVSTQVPVADFSSKIVIALLAPIAWNEQTFNISASIGTAMYPTAGTTPEGLLVQADIEMHRVKRERTLSKVTPIRGAQPANLPVFSLNIP